MKDSLDSISMLEEVIIKEVKGNKVMRRRLLDLGFIPGSYVRLALISPFNDPKAYEIHGNMIALRDSDAKNIIVERDSYETD